MDSLKRKTPRRIVTVVALVLLLVALYGRWISSSLTLGTDVTGTWCDDRGDYCVEHVQRGEWLFLEPFDEFHVVWKGQPRYYSATNPFHSEADLVVEFGAAGVSVTDGSSVLSWPATTLARLGD